MVHSSFSWHWRAFLAGGGSAIWLFAYGIFYWVSRLTLGSLSSVILYMGYLLLLTILTFLVTGKPLNYVHRPNFDSDHASSTGTIGFLATYWAVRRLYAAIRID